MSNRQARIRYKAERRRKKVLATPLPENWVVEPLDFNHILQLAVYVPETDRRYGLRTYMSRKWKYADRTLEMMVRIMQHRLKPKES